jgi:hypothetical protein
VLGFPFPHYLNFAFYSLNIAQLEATTKKGVAKCHFEESVILIGGRPGISHCLEHTQSEIPLRRLTDRNDGSEGFLRSL